MPVTVSNLLMGPATIFVAPFGTTEPATAATAPAAGWIDVGGTMDGATLSISQTYTELVVDQIAQRVGSRLTEQNFSVAVSLAEATLANLRLSMNLAVAAGTSLELDSIISNADPLYVAVLLQGQKPGGGNRNVIIRRALSVEGAELSFSKDGQTVLPVTWQSHYVSSTVKSIKIDDSP